MTGTAFPTQRGVTWRRAAILALLTIGLAVLASSDALHAALIDVLQVVSDIIGTHPVFGAVLFVLFAAASAMLAFVSVAVLLPVVAFAWGEPLSILLLWIGWTLGGALTWAIGRFLGRAVVSWLTADSLLRRLEAHLGPSTPFTVVLLFQLAMPSEIPGYVLGLVRYSFLRYLLVLGFVELLYTVAMVHLGSSFIERSTAGVLVTGIAIASTGLLAVWLLRRRLSKGDSGPAGGGAGTGGSEGFELNRK